MYLIFFQTCECCAQDKYYECSQRHLHFSPNKWLKSINPACPLQTEVHQYLLQLCNIIQGINVKRATSSLYNQPVRRLG